jgi:5-hydroxyisourate hydrolase
MLLGYGSSLGGSTYFDPRLEETIEETLNAVMRLWTVLTLLQGRVTSWQPSTPFSSDTLETVFHKQGDQRYSLTFDTEAYFSERSIKTFFPEVEVKFVVRQEAKGEHYHVPVLLGPFGYTTYRGS